MAVLGAAVFAHPALAAPLEAYGGLPDLENVVISPDGEKLAFVTNLNDKRTIIVVSIKERKNLSLLGAGAQKVRALQWAGPSHLLVTTSITTQIPDLIGPAQEYFGVQSYDLEKHRFTPFMEHIKGDETMLNVVIGTPDLRTVDGKIFAYVLGVHFVEHKGQPGLFRVDVASGRTELIDGGGRGSYSWLIGQDGSKLARTDYDDGKRRWSLKVFSPKGWVERMDADAPIERPALAGLAPNGTDVLVREQINQKSALTGIAIADGKRSGPVGSPGYIDLIEDPITHRVIGGMRMGTAFEYDFFDPKDQAVWKAVAKAFPGEVVRLESWSDDRKKIVVRVDGPTSGASFALVDMNTHKGEWIGDLYQSLKAEDISPVREISYAAADGLRIPAYLTLPRGREAKNLPLVVLPHGGPAVRDAPGFDWWAQALASQGYAVLQPQYRGSDGFGAAFMEAGYGQWGRKMQTDLSDGVRFLAKDGTIDPAKVCIVGASYGGYAALAGAAFDGTVYRCAASISGPSDLRRMLQWTQNREGRKDSRQLRYWTRFMGADNPRDAALSVISPADHVENVHIPILLVHGRDDTVVDYEQSKIMGAALARAGKPATFVTLNGEDHWLSRDATRKQMLKAVVDFLKVNNPPG